MLTPTRRLQIASVEDVRHAAAETAETLRRGGIAAIPLLGSFLVIQVFRRLYECSVVNVNSGSTMSILHYIVGYAHYACSGAAILINAPGFCGEEETLIGAPFKVNPMQICLAFVFLWAWNHQFIAHKIFADLRRSSKSGKSYHLPKGDWFHWVSCPHYLAEVIMYGCLAILVGIENSTACLMFAWVLINQVVAALMSHQWYRENFKDYPKERRAIIPFVI